MPHPEGPECNGGSASETVECCSEENPCSEGQGDCDSDSECLGDLRCGTNNCGAAFESDQADCCFGEIGKPVIN